MQDESRARKKLWKRSLKIYAYHLMMLALVFTVAAAFAVHTHKAALNHLLSFYLAHPLVAVVGSILLIYCPPLLDILPMYVTFLFFTPLFMSAAVRWGWSRIMAVSGLLWLFAQFGLRDLVHNWVVYLTHLQIPLQETGAFNLFAWQAIWMAGLWIGARSATHAEPVKFPGWVPALSTSICLFFIGVRHGWLGAHLTQQALGMQLDKWQLGPLRVVNLVAFTLVAYWLRQYLVRLVAIEPFLTLGKASLRVFCAHIFFVFVGLALLYKDVGADTPGEIEQLHGFTATALLVITFIALILVAADEVRKRRVRANAHRSRRPASLDSGQQNLRGLEATVERDTEQKSARRSGASIESASLVAFASGGTVLGIAASPVCLCHACLSVRREGLASEQQAGRDAAQAGHQKEEPHLG